MIKKSTIAAIGLSSLVCGSAMAEGNYFGGSFAALDYSDDSVDQDFSLTAVYGRLGTNFSENFSGEIRVGTGVGDDSVSYGGINANIELDTIYGLYVRAGIPVTESFFPYAVVGYTRGELTLSVSGLGSASESESDASFGLGADFNLTQNVIINGEYMSYFDKDGAEISGFSIGLTTAF